jgi:hypothetical protein
MVRLTKEGSLANKKQMHVINDPGILSSTTETDYQNNDSQVDQSQTSKLGYWLVTGGIFYSST